MILEVPFTFPVSHQEARMSHVPVGVEDNRHDVPRGAELRRRGVSAELSQEVPLILRDAIVDFDVVVGAVGVVLQLEVVERQKHGRTLGHHDQPGAVDAVRVKTWEIRAGDVAAGGRGEDSSAFYTCVETDDKPTLLLLFFFYKVWDHQLVSLR